MLSLNGDDEIVYVGHPGEYKYHQNNNKNTGNYAEE